MFFQRNLIKKGWILLWREKGSKELGQKYKGVQEKPEEGFEKTVIKFAIIYQEPAASPNFQTDSFI